MSLVAIVIWSVMLVIGLNRARNLHGLINFVQHSLRTLVPIIPTSLVGIDPQPCEREKP